ncbi:hypothetical protein ACFFHM_03650 [Halalkalibacter kiskunsagensis]|uniref:Uncharacterized protein n=1 Tax=Halalkalibacter kiskunsagensis TaxID=1548599 RepID=A0ABV6K8K6_9BACI
MLKAVVAGVFFVILCVAIPSLLGYYHSDNNRPFASFVKESEYDTSLEQRNDEKSMDLKIEHELDKMNDSQEEENQELVYATSDEAMEAVLKHFSLTELISIYQSVRHGVDEEKREELLTMLQERFSDEEIEALKVIGFSELDKALQ